MGRPRGGETIRAPSGFHPGGGASIPPLRPPAGTPREAGRPRASRAGPFRPGARHPKEWTLSQSPPRGAPAPTPAAPPSAPGAAGEPEVFRGFYEEVAGRQIDTRTARGIEYRNTTIERRVGPGPLAVLEIGPGEGWLVRRLLGRGHRVVTTDLSRGWLKRLPSAADPRLLRAQANIFHLPFRDGLFDVVVAAEVLEHLPGPVDAVREIRRVLKPGGRFIATVPYREELRPVICAHCGQLFEKNGHLNSFDETTLAELFRAAGLAPGHLFVGPTRFSREIWVRRPVPFLLGALHLLDRLTLGSQRVSDTWMLREGRRVE